MPAEVVQDMAEYTGENSTKKKVSVLMGVYNCEATVEQAIRSIQAQTYKNWELIICNDGSTDGTYERVAAEAEKDPRILLINNPENMGLNRTLNRCLEKATGDYIARMDGDDDCLPNRFELQLDLLTADPNFEIVSSPMIFFDENGEWGQNYVPEYPTPESVVAGSPICHAPVMMTRECIDSVGGYSEDRSVLRVEDVDLWIRLYAAGYRCCNIQVPLYRMRNDRNALIRRKYRYRINSTRVRLRGCRMLGLGFKSYLKAFKPMLIGLVPAGMRARYRRIKGNKQ